MSAPDFLTVPELADMLRIRERKVYDLAASGRVPCSRATGKLLFPAAEIRAWIARESGGGASVPTARPPILLGSHDPLLDWALRQSGSGIAAFADGSSDGLTRFIAGEGIAAGLHLRDAEGGWNIAQVDKLCREHDAVLIGFAGRERGLLTVEDRRIDGIGDLEGLRLVRRQAGSGTQPLLESLLSEAGIDIERAQWTDVARSETEAAETVARGAADAAFGLRAQAVPFGLSFHPVLTERFDLLVDRRAWFDPPWQGLLSFCRSSGFADRARSLGGYDITDLGQVRWNA